MLGTGLPLAHALGDIPGPRVARAVWCSSSTGLSCTTARSSCTTARSSLSTSLLQRLQVLRVAHGAHDAAAHDLPELLQRLQALRVTHILALRRYSTGSGVGTAGGAQRRPSRSPAFDKASRRSAALLLHHQRPSPPRGTPGSGRGERAPERSLVGGRGRAAGSRAPPDRRQQSLRRSQAAAVAPRPLTSKREPPQQRSSPRCTVVRRAAGAAPPRRAPVGAPNYANRLVARLTINCALGSLGFPLPSQKIAV